MDDNMKGSTRAFALTKSGIGRAAALELSTLEDLVSVANMRNKQPGANGLRFAEIGSETCLYRGDPELLRLGVALGGTLIDTAE